jgi:hypothetical protein
MAFLDEISENIKNTYYFLEDKWYNTLDKIDEKVPIYNVIDPVDEVIPSFILFLLIILFFVILLGYFIQFGSSYDIIFTTYDSVDRDPLSGVSLEGEIREELFRGQTNSSGEFTQSALAENKNIYAVIGAALFGSSDNNTLGYITARKQGYNTLERVDVEIEKEQDLFLEPESDDAPTYGDSTIVYLANRANGRKIIDSTNVSEIRFACANKQITTRTVKDGSDGALDGDFVLNEPNCQFKVISASAPGFVTKNNSIVLPTNLDIHKIDLDKETVITTGTAKVWVKNADGNYLTGIRVLLGDHEATTNNTGAAIFNNIEPKTYNITISDDNYYAITPEDGINLTVTVNSTTETEVTLTRIPQDQIRRVYLKIIDSETKEGISRASVDLLYIKEDGNKLVVLESDGDFSRVSDKSKANEDGEYEVSGGLSTSKEGKLIAIIKEDDYLLEVLRPTLFTPNSGPQIVELEKANASNSGFAEVLVSDIDDRKFIGAKSYILLKTTLDGDRIENIPLPSKDGIQTNNEGKAFFENLNIGNNFDYTASAEYNGVYGIDSNSKNLDANQTIYFNVIIDFEVSKLNVKLLNRLTNDFISDSNNTIDLYNTNDELVQRLSYSQGTYVSNFISREDNYYLKVNSQNFVNTQVAINNLLIGDNEITIKLWPNDNDDSDNPGCDGYGCDIDEDNITDGNVLIMLEDIYELENRFFTEESTAFILEDNNSYIARFDLIIGKDLNYKTLMGMVRTDGAEIENVFINPRKNLTEVDSFSCSNIDQDDLDEEDRTEDYYLLKGDDCDEDTDIVAGARWDNNNLEKGVYSLAIKFKVTDDEKIEFAYRAREYDENNISETRLKTKEYPVGVPFREGVYISVGFNDSKYNYFESEVINKITIPAQKSNNLEIIVHNNSLTDKDNGELNIYSHIGPLNQFDSNSPNGEILLDGENKLTLSNNLSINRGTSANYDVNAFTENYNSNQYIIIILEFPDEQLIAYLDTSISGKPITLSTEFFTAIPNQTIDGTIDSEFGDPVIDYLTARVYNNCNTTNPTLADTFSFSSASSEIDEDYFQFIVDGVYTSTDCIIYDIISRDKDTSESFAQFNKTVYANNNDALDLSLGCVDIITANNEDQEITLNWKEQENFIIQNNCSVDVTVQVETALVCESNGSTCFENSFDISQGESKNLIVTGKNVSYDEDADSPNFTDILGNFPIYIKAKRMSADNFRSRFALVDEFTVHLVDNLNCFAISKDEFDFATTDVSQEEFFIENACQYIEFENYYIPKATINAFGYKLENPYHGPETTQNFGVELLVDGVGYITKESTELKVTNGGIIGRHAIFTDTVTNIDTNRARYSINFDFNPENINSAYSSDWNIQKLQIRIIDLKNDNNSHGAKVEDDKIKINYIDGTSNITTLSDSFELDPFRCSNNSPTCELEYGLGEEHLGGEDFVFGLFYHFINPSKKIGSIDMNFIADINSSTLEFNARPEIIYKVTNTVLEPDPSGTTSEIVLDIGDFEILNIEGVDFVIGHINEFDAFDDQEFLIRLNPNIAIKTNNPKIVAWVDRGYLMARYIGENISELNDSTIETDLIEITGSGIIYGKVNISDYVSSVVADSNNKIITGDIE